MALFVRIMHKVYKFKKNSAMQVASDYNALPQMNQGGSANPAMYQPQQQSPYFPNLQVGYAFLVLLTAVILFFARVGVR